jgi:hypothetical protein
MTLDLSCRNASSAEGIHIKAAYLLLLIKQFPAFLASMLRSAEFPESRPPIFSVLHPSASLRSRCGGWAKKTPNAECPVERFESLMK